MFLDTPQLDLFVYSIYIYIYKGVSFMDDSGYITYIYIYIMNDIGLNWTYEWDPSVLSLDSMFVTPLVVTQLLNMLLETWLPYIIRKIRVQMYSESRGSILIGQNYVHESDWIGPPIYIYTYISIRACKAPEYNDLLFPWSFK
jgi:hypothetical protein